MQNFGQKHGRWSLKWGGFLVQLQTRRVGFKVVVQSGHSIQVIVMTILTVPVIFQMNKVFV